MRALFFMPVFRWRQDGRRPGAEVGEGSFGITFKGPARLHHPVKKSSRCA